MGRCWDGGRRGRGIPSATSSGWVAHTLPTAPLVSLGAGTVDKAWVTPSTVVPSIRGRRFPCRRGQFLMSRKTAMCRRPRGRTKPTGIRPLNRAMLVRATARPSLIHASPTATIPEIRGSRGVEAGATQTAGGLIGAMFPSGPTFTNWQRPAIEWGDVPPDTACRDRHVLSIQPASQCVDGLGGR